MELRYSVSGVRSVKPTSIKYYVVHSVACAHANTSVSAKTKKKKIPFLPSRSLSGTDFSSLGIPNGEWLLDRRAPALYGGRLVFGRGIWAGESSRVRESVCVCVRTFVKILVCSVGSTEALLWHAIRLHSAVKTKTRQSLTGLSRHKVSVPVCSSLLFPHNDLELVMAHRNTLPCP